MCLTNIGLRFEENYGLTWLFKMRGQISAPQDVVIINIDQLSAEMLHLPNDPEKWPRNYYAQLIDKLNYYQPAVIAFNIHFGENRDNENDILLAQAMRQKRNIILSNYIKQFTIPSIDPINVFKYEQVIDPVPVLDQAALATAPFPLPRTFSSVKQFWTFKNTAGDIPTFPMTIFQYYVYKNAYSEILQLFEQVDAELKAELPKTFKEFNVIDAFQKTQFWISKHPEALYKLKLQFENQDFSKESKVLLKAWLAAFNLKDRLYLNHYGATGKIISIPFFQALNANVYDPGLFHNKIILIGYSENIEPERNQGLYTVFSDDNEKSTSPIEIAATAVANLLECSWFSALEGYIQAFIVLTWGLLLTLACRLTQFKYACSLIIGLCLIYLAIAHGLFTYYTVWIPVFAPLLMQAPIMLILIAISYFMKSRQDHKKMHKAFCFYIPNTVVNKIVQHSDNAEMNLYGEQMHGVCMASDAGQYTALSETMNSYELHQLINQYYAVMFSQVKDHHGMISDVVGDAMMALWATPTIQCQTRVNALNAALKIKAAVHAFNQSQQHQLPTRLGLHYGEMRIGNVGAADHFEYRAIGDIVNTASRIEGLNKQLGTEILVTESVIKDLSGFCCREMGYFVLKGKTNPIAVYELMDYLDQDISVECTLMFTFGHALKLFQNYQTEKALAAFLKIQQDFPHDGPTLFYIRYLKTHQAAAVDSPNPERINFIDIDISFNRLLQ